MTNGMPNEVPIGVPNGVTIGVTNGVYNGVPIGVTNGVPNGVPNGLPIGVPNRVPIDVTNGVPNGVPSGVPTCHGTILLIISRVLLRFHHCAHPSESVSQRASNALLRFLNGHRLPSKPFDHPPALPPHALSARTRKPSFERVRFSENPSRGFGCDLMGTNWRGFQPS